MTKQRKHIRTSKKGKRFSAGTKKLKNNNFVPGAKAVMTGLNVSTDKFKRQLKDGIKEFAPHGIKIIGSFKTLPGRGGPGGRNDVVIVFDSRDTGRLAVSPFHLGGGFSWIDDYYSNNQEIIPQDAKSKFFGGQSAEEEKEKIEDKQKYFLFLDGLRESGVTNMWGARPFLMEEFEELDKKEAGEILSEWMRTFSKRHKKK